MTLTFPRTLFTRYRTPIDVKNVYLVYDFFGIEYFLTVFDPCETNLLIVSDTLARSEFLSKISARNHIIAVPSDLQLPHPNPPMRDWKYVLLEIKKERQRLKRLLRQVTKDASVFIFHDFSLISFFITVGIFRRRGLTVKFIDAHPWLKTEPSSEELLSDRPPDFPDFLRRLSTAAGVQITEVVYKPTLIETPPPSSPESIAAVGYGLVIPLERVSISPMPWPDIIAKFGLEQPAVEEDAVLIIDANFKMWPSIDYERTKSNVVRFITARIKSNTKIHIKPHYARLDEHIFKDTLLDHMVKVLPSDFPVEILMDNYREIFLFKSFSGRCPTKGKKYCLSNLVVFRDKSTKSRYWQVQKLSFGDEMDNIEFVSDSGNS